MSDDAAIDRAAIDQLLETTGNDPAFVAELIDTYLADSDALLDTIQQSIDAANPEAVRRAAHSLKSNSATFGARSLAAECLALERQAREGALDGAAARATEIAHQFRVVERDLRVLRLELTQQ